jgi:uncharacterized protein (UPF0333 family)
MTDNNQPDVNGAQNVVYVKKRSTYTPFLLVMLILSSIFTAFSAIGIVVAVGELISNNSGSSGVISTLVNVFSLLISVGSIAALALLWMKKKEGIILKFLLLSLSVIVAVISIGFVKGGSFNTDNECREILAQQSTYNVQSNPYDRCKEQRVVFNFLDELAENLTVFGIILSVFWNGGIAALWFFAWRAQEKHDGIEKFLGKKTAK